MSGETTADAMMGPDTAVGGWGDPVLGQDLQPGDVVGRYRLLERVGMGGYGVVYAADDPRLGRIVALKVLQPHRRTESARQELLDEARAMARVVHENVVVVTDVGLHGDDVFFVMEFVAGRTLAKWLRARPRSRDEIIEVFVAAGRGLEAAHAAGVVHRDFKPANVMLDDRSRVRVMDFGLATAAPNDLSEAVVGAGTPRYMSPEQHRRAQLGPASDQFSFCVALYEALFDQHPFEGDSPVAIAASVMTGRTSATSKTTVPKRVRLALARGLADAPQDRWPSMTDLLRQLDPRVPVLRRVAVPLLLTGLVAGGFVLSTGVVNDPCPPAADRLEGVWDDQRRAEVADAFGTVDVEYASEAATRVGAALDRYTKDWLTTHAEVCRASAREQVLDARMQCLTRRLDDLDALSTVLAEPNALSVESAPQAVAALVAPAACHNAQARAEPNTAQAHSVLSVQRKALARARWLFEAGRFIDAAQTLAATEPTPAWDDAPELRVEYDLQRGRVLARLEKLEAAQRHLEDAAWAAMAVGDRDRAVQASAELVLTVGRDRLDTAGGDAWLERALGLAAEGTDAHRALVHDHAGHYLLRVGRPQEAREHFGEALAIYERALPTSAPRMAQVIHGVGKADYMAGNDSQARDAFRRARDLFVEAYGPGHPWAAAAVAGLAAVARRAKRLDEALEYSREVLEIRLRVYGPDSVHVAGILNNLGNLYSDRGEPRLALDALGRAAEIWRAADDEAGLSWVMNSLGNVHSRMDQTEEAMRHWSLSVEYGRRSFGPTHPSLAEPLRSLGEAHRASGRPLDAVAALTEALHCLATSPPERAVDTQLELLGAINDAGYVGG